MINRWKRSSVRRKISLICLLTFFALLILCLIGFFLDQNEWSKRPSTIPSSCSKDIECPFFFVCLNDQCQCDTARGFGGDGCKVLSPIKKNLWILSFIFILPIEWTCLSSLIRSLCLIKNDKSLRIKDKVTWNMIVVSACRLIFVSFQLLMLCEQRMNYEWFKNTLTLPFIGLKNIFYHYTLIILLEYWFHSLFLLPNFLPSSMPLQTIRNRGINKTLFFLFFTITSSFAMYVQQAKYTGKDEINLPKQMLSPLSIVFSIVAFSILFLGMPFWYGLVVSGTAASDHELHQLIFFIRSSGMIPSGSLALSKTSLIYEGKWARRTSLSLTLLYVLAVVLWEISIKSTRHAEVDATQHILQHICYFLACLMELSITLYFMKKGPRQNQSKTAGREIKPTMNQTTKATSIIQPSDCIDRTSNGPEMIVNPPRPPNSASPKKTIQLRIKKYLAQQTQPLNSSQSKSSGNSSSLTSFADSPQQLMKPRAAGKKPKEHRDSKTFNFVVGVVVEEGLSGRFWLVFMEKKNAMVVLLQDEVHKRYTHFVGASKDEIRAWLDLPPQESFSLNDWAKICQEVLGSFECVPLGGIGEEEFYFGFSMVMGTECLPLRMKPLETTPKAFPRLRLLEVEQGRPVFIAKLENKKFNVGMLSIYASPRESQFQLYLLRRLNGGMLRASVTLQEFGYSATVTFSNLPQGRLQQMCWKILTGIRISEQLQISIVIDDGQTPVGDGEMKESSEFSSTFFACNSEMVDDNEDEALL